MSELAQWFRETKVDTIIDQQQIVLLQDTATVDLALRTLAKHRILSAPMVINHQNGDPKGPRTSQHGITPEQITGFCDIRDILSSFLKEFNVKEVSAMKMLQRMRLLEDKGAQFCKKELKELPVLNSDGKFSGQLSDSLSLAQLISNVFLADNIQNIVHRVAMFDHEGGIVKILSQTDLIKLLVNNKEKIGDLANKTLEELGLAKKPVISVPPEISAFETLAKIQDEGISAVAIVNQEGGIIGNFSVSELRTILAEHFGSLSLPVGEFLALEHGTEYSGYGIYNTNEVQDAHGTHGHAFAKAVDQRQHPGQEVGQNLIVCSKNETLLQAMELITTNQIHRVYVVSEDKKPLSVVTLSDILVVINQHILQ